MLSAIKSFFETNMLQVEGKDSTEHSLKLATAALMVEMMRMDDHIHEDEETAMMTLVKEKFQLTDDETDELISLAKSELKNSTDYFQFTSLINKQFSYAEKTHIIELLWQLAYADNVLNKDEEYLVRKISELIYVSHSDFIAAKLKVRPANI